MKWANYETWSIHIWASYEKKIFEPILQPKGVKVKPEAIERLVKINWPKGPKGFNGKDLYKLVNWGQIADLWNRKKHKGIKPKTLKWFEDD